MSDAPRIGWVEIVENHETGEIDVWPYWKGADRRKGVGFALGAGRNKKRLAQRLNDAILAGVVFVNPQVKKDVNGRTYVHARCNVNGRRLNADLKRLGF